MFKSAPPLYRELESTQDVDSFVQSGEPVWLLKHSATCSISFIAMAHFNQYLRNNPVEAGMLVVQKHRPASQHVAERFGVQHESPQLFLIRQGEVLWHTSHGGITADAMQHAYEQAGRVA